MSAVSIVEFAATQAVAALAIGLVATVASWSERPFAATPAGPTASTRIADILRCPSGEASPPDLMALRFGPGVSGGRFTASVLAAAAAALTIWSIAWFADADAFRAQVAADPFARGRILRALVLNGLPIVFLTTFAAHLVHSKLTVEHGVLGPLPSRRVGVDLAVRLAVFGIVVIAVFQLLVWGVGAFGGDPLAALAATPEILRRAVAFQDLFGVYLYATLFAATPLWAALLLEAATRRRWVAATLGALGRRLPEGLSPVRRLAIAVGLAHAAGFLVFEIALAAARRLLG
ncbi:MAG: hypothetical protein LWW93_09435 [Hyphomicrobiales bacterium]|nr:hypothetical protein [Hyphomicrobiales bacterium]